MRPTWAHASAQGKPGQPAVRVGHQDVFTGGAAGLGQCRPGQGRGVVALTEVRRHHMVQAGMLAASQDLCGREVVQMPQSPTDAGLQRPGVGRGRQQRAVVVALQQQRIAPGQVFQDVVGGTARVGEYPQALRTIAEGHLQRLLGVVGHGVGRDLQAAQLDDLAITRKMQQAIQGVALSGRFGLAVWLGGDGAGV